jgi:hypothetical protein
MKRFVIWFSIIIAGCCSIISTNVQERSRRGTVSTLQEATIAFVTSNPPGSSTQRAFCGGVWISRDLILTVKHCVTASNPMIDFIIQNGSSIDLSGLKMEYLTQNDVVGKLSIDSVPRRASVVVVDEFQDLAVVRAHADDIEDHPVVPIAFQSPRDGDPVHIVGHTMGMWWTYHKGYVSATRSPIYGPQNEATKALQVASPANRGNSGGGAFNEDGELVGVMSWITTSAPECGFFIHKDEIVAFIRRHRLND